MIVKWNQERVKVIPVVTSNSTQGKGASGKGKITLLPGYNEVNNGDMQVILDSKIVQDQIDNKIIEIIAEVQVVEIENKGKKVKVQQRKPIALRSLKPNETKKIIKETNDPKTIEKWLKKEVREEVRLYLKQRLDEIEEFINKEE